MARLDQSESGWEVGHGSGQPVPTLSQPYPVGFLIGLYHEEAQGPHGRSLSRRIIARCWRGLAFSPAQVYFCSSLVLGFAVGIIGNTVRNRDVPNAVRWMVQQEPLTARSGRGCTARSRSQKTGQTISVPRMDRRGTAMLPRQGIVMQQPSTLAKAGPFSEAEREAVYRAIHTRRDVRSQFLPRQIDAAVLDRLLLAAHHAPSVGFMQPWNFLIVTDPGVKASVKAAFSRANDEAARLCCTNSQGFPA